MPTPSAPAGRVIQENRAACWGPAVALVLLLLSRCSGALPCRATPAAVANAAWLGCSSTAGSTCAATCDPGYGSRATPVSTCDGLSGKWSTPVGTCARVCTTAPPAAALPNGAWDPTCAGRVAMSGTNTRCFGACNPTFVGTPSIQCTTSNWTLQVGACVTAPACSGFPATVFNGQPWPLACADSTAGTVCQGSCNPNYQGSGPPTSTCLATGQWSAPSPCTYGTVAPALPSPSPTPCLPITVFDNTNLPVSSAISFTDLTATYGDFLGITQTGVLEELTIRVAAQSLGVTGDMTIRVYSNDGSSNPSSLGTLVGSFIRPIAGTGRYIFSNLASLNINLASTITITQQLANVAGTTTAGTLYSSSTANPTVGTQLTTGAYSLLGGTSTYNNLGGGSRLNLLYTVKIVNTACASP